MIELLKSQLKKHEGFSSKPYLDSVGVLTIGYGTNIAGGITKEEAEFLLENRAKLAIDDARSLFSRFDESPVIVQAVIANMSYQLGKSRLAGFVKFREAIQSKDYGKAADEMKDSLWYKQSGNRSVELESMIRGLV